MGQPPAHQANEQTIRDILGLSPTGSDLHDYGDGYRTGLMVEVKTDEAAATYANVALEQMDLAADWEGAAARGLLTDGCGVTAKSTGVYKTSYLSSKYHIPVAYIHLIGSTGTGWLYRSDDMARHLGDTDYRVGWALAQKRPEGMVMVTANRLLPKNAPPDFVQRFTGLDQLPELLSRVPRWAPMRLPYLSRYNPVARLAGLIPGNGGPLKDRFTKPFAHVIDGGPKCGPEPYSHLDLSHLLVTPLGPC